MFVKHYYANGTKSSSVMNLKLVQKFRANQGSNRLLNPKLILLVLLTTL
jgi:hypothetical protein